MLRLSDFRFFFTSCTSHYNALCQSIAKGEQKTTEEEEDDDAAVTAKREARRLDSPPPPSPVTTTTPTSLLQPAATCVLFSRLRRFHLYAEWHMSGTGGTGGG